MHTYYQAIVLTPTPLDAIRTQLVRQIVRVVVDIAAAFRGVDALLERSVCRVVAGV